MFSKANASWKLLWNVIEHKLIAHLDPLVGIMLFLILLTTAFNSSFIRVIEITALCGGFIWLAYFIYITYKQYRHYYNIYHELGDNILIATHDDEKIITSFRVLFGKNHYSSEEIAIAKETAVIAMVSMKKDLWEYNPGQYTFTQLAIIHEFIFRLRDRIAEDYKRPHSLIDEDFKKAYLELGSSLFMYLDAPTQFKTVVRVISRF